MQNLDIQKKGQRIEYMDSIAGIMIVYMICHHILQWSGIDVINTSFMRPLFFFMAWFFFKSGIFHRNNSTKEMIKKNYDRLIQPFIVFTIIGYLLYCIQLFINNDFNWVHYTLTPAKQLLLNGSINGNEPLWFLFSLFIVKIICNIILEQNKFIISSVIACLIAFTFFTSRIKCMPDWAMNICIGSIFYSLGYIIKEKQFTRLFYITSIIIYISTLVLCYSYVDIHTNKLLCGNYFLWYISSLSGCILINNLFYRHLYLNKLPFGIIGKRSMILYVTHWFVLIITSLLFKNVLSHNGFIISLFTMNILLLPLISYVYSKYLYKYIKL